MASNRAAKTKKSFKQQIAKSVSNLFHRIDDVNSVKRNFIGSDDVPKNGDGNRASQFEFEENIKNISISTPSFSPRSSEPDLDVDLKSIILETTDRYLLPLIYPPDNSDYLIEGFAQLESRKINNLEYVNIENDEIPETNREYRYYSNYFYGREHLDYVGKADKFGDFILSVKSHPASQLTCILRTKDGNTILSDIQLKDVSLYSILNKFNEAMVVTDMKPVLHHLASNLIVNYDNDVIKTKFTFGIIYQKFGQTNEKEIFDNQEHSVEFDDFLNFIGLRIKLKNFANFKGGLDITSDDTGQESIYASYDNSEIMFHVSTLLPHSHKDTQQIERKRHIGNDRVAIVFQDECTPFSPTMIKSKLLHVFIIIQPIKIDGKTDSYQLSVLSRKDVPYFGPFIAMPYVFKKDNTFKNFLLTKLINAEYASLRAPAFSQFSEKILSSSLTKLCDTLRDLTNRFNSYERLESQLTDSPRPKNLLITTPSNSSAQFSYPETAHSPSKGMDSVFKNVVNRFKKITDDRSERSFKQSFKDKGKSDSLTSESEQDSLTNPKQGTQKSENNLSNRDEEKELLDSNRVSDDDKSCMRQELKQALNNQLVKVAHKPHSKSLDSIDATSTTKRVSTKFSKKIEERFHLSARKKDEKDEKN